MSKMFRKRIKSLSKRTFGRESDADTTQEAPPAYSDRSCQEDRQLDRPFKRDPSELEILQVGSTRSQNSETCGSPSTSWRSASLSSASDFRKISSHASINSDQPRVSPARVKLVIGIDFGTTFSGVAYAVVHPGYGAVNVKVTTIREWDRGPNGNRVVANKVPTVIAFDQADGDKAYWGCNIPQRLREDSVKYVKLLLEPDIARKVSTTSNIIDPEATQDFLDKVSKSAVAAASTYVKLFWQHAEGVIIQHIGATAYRYAEKVVVFTVPAVWSERAKHNTYMLAVEAGLAHKNFQLHMVSEPEAAAIAVLNEPVQAAQLRQNDVYIIVDAGGGTVDLTSYKISSTEPLQLEEVVAGDGAVCGAKFLEVNFHKLLEQTFGIGVIKALNAFHYDRIVGEWEPAIRDSFTGTDDWHYAVNAPGLSETRFSRINDGMIHFTVDEIRPVFDPIIDSIKKLVKKQISMLERRGLFPKAIILVGGLGCNRHLALQLKDTYEDTDHSIQRGRIKVLQPDFALESVAQGAVKCNVFGLGTLVPLRIARYNLGTSCNEQWDSDIHLPDQKYRCSFTGDWLAGDSIDWHIRRNSELPPDRVIRFRSFWDCWESDIDAALAQEQQGRAMRATTLLLASTDDEVLYHTSPSTRTFAEIVLSWNFSEWPKETFPLKFSPSGRAYRTFKHEIQIVQSMAGMRFNLYVKGDLQGEIADVKFLSIPEVIDRGTRFGS